MSLSIALSKSSLQSMQLVRSLSFGTGKLRQHFAVLSYKVVSKITEASLKISKHNNCCLFLVLPESYRDEQSSACVCANTVWSYKRILNALCTMIWFKDNLKLSPASSAGLTKGFLTSLEQVGLQGWTEIICKMTESDSCAQFSKAPILRLAWIE